MAHDLSLSTSEDKPVVIALAASDADDDVLAYTVVTSPTHGTLSGIAPDLVYTPRTDFNGSDGFTFEVNDGETASNLATVAVTVNPINDRPSVHDRTQALDEDGTLPIMLTGHDADGDLLTTSIMRAPAHGSLTGTPPLLLYTPNPDYHGTDNFTFRTHDGMVNSAYGTISLVIDPIQDPPRLAAVGDVTMDAGTVRSFTLVASDPEGDELSLAATSLPRFASFTDHGQGKATLTLTPDIEDDGAYPPFEIVADDGFRSARTTVAVEVAPMAPAPSARLSASKGLNADELESGALVVAASPSSGATSPDHAIDAKPGTSWCTTVDDAYAPWMIVQLLGSRTQVVDQVVMAGGSGRYGVKDFEVLTSATGTAQADFTTLLSATLPQDTALHTFAFSPTQARYVKLVIHSFWNNLDRGCVPMFELWTRSRHGGIVSLTDGPESGRATMIDFSTQASGAQSPSAATDFRANTYWRTAPGATTDQWLTLDLVGGEAHRINQVHLRGAGGARAPKNFQVRVSNNSTDAENFVTVLEGELPNDGRLASLCVRLRHRQICSAPHR